jgi:hypothetical protein
VARATAGVDYESFSDSLNIYQNEYILKNIIERERRQALFKLSFDYQKITSLNATGGQFR